MNAKVIRKLYNQFIEENLVAMFSCYKPMWIHPKDLQVRRPTEMDDFRACEKGPIDKYDKGDPYLTAQYNQSFDLGKDLLKIGTYWPMLVNDRPEGYFVKEGNHRIAAIKLLIEKDLWPEDRLLFCMVYKENVYDPMWFLLKPVTMLRFKSDGRIKHIFEFGKIEVETAAHVVTTFNHATPYFRNYIWDYGGVLPHEKINNIKFKYYWDNKYIEFRREYES